MRETAFINQNKLKWTDFENLMKKRSGSYDPEKLIELYHEILDDLSYAKTYFPNTRTVQYLNQSAIICHQKVYKKSENHNSFSFFWKHTHPVILYKHRKILLLSFLIMAISIFIGVLSAHNDSSFINLILGDSYVNMTIENIKNNDPMAVYKTMISSDMFAAITVNNIKVAFMAFTAGIIFSFGSAYILFQNGIMLGAFHYIFYSHGLLYKSLMTVWIHGSLEVPAIIIAGSAGIVLGNSFMFPGTYSRIESFRKGAGEAAAIILGIVPVFVAAGFLEGYVTRYTEIPFFVNLSIITFNLLYITCMYVIIPGIKYLRGEHEK